MAMYKSPIDIVQTGMRVKIENGIIKTVQDVGINVDKAELLKALAYDREQYQKGFADGRVAGHEWISVKDRLPGIDKRIGDHVYSADMLVYDGSRRQEAYYCHTTNEWYNSYDEELIRVTHWMPLPEPPEEA